MKKRHLTLLLATCLLVTSCLFGCGDDPKPSDDNSTTTPKVETTTKEDVTTTEPTTEEPTTPEETTTIKLPVHLYKFKGEKLVVEMDKKDFFTELVIEDGTKIYLNDIYGGTTNDDDRYRANIAQAITIAIWKEYNEDKVGEFEDKYWEPGTDVFLISFEQNAVIEYNEGHRWYFYYVGENDKGYAVFDIYEID